MPKTEKQKVEDMIKEFNSPERWQVAANIKTKAKKDVEHNGCNPNALSTIKLSNPVEQPQQIIRL